MYTLVWSHVMSNQQNEAILERLYEEAYEQLVHQHPSWKAYISPEKMHNAAVELAKKRWENNYE
jgi:hypothetical protein